ncbi:hypothetical protein HPMBJEAJ_00350 [Aeromonas phage avDM6]|nr:hypothetical protein HPMBJEAJ_00350 [Aeromonas phage avDM6]
MTVIINTLTFVCFVFSIAYVLVYVFEKYRSWKLNNIPTHYQNALSELGYAVYCDYKNEWFSWNKWGIKKHDQPKPIVVFSADDFYPKLKKCFTYTPNKIYVDSEKISKLFEECNTLPRINLKQW